MRAASARPSQRAAGRHDAAPAQAADPARPKQASAPTGVTHLRPARLLPLAPAGDPNLPRRSSVSLNLVVLLYLVASVCFIQALKGLSHPTTSRLGNTFGMVGMAIAVVTTARADRQAAAATAAARAWSGWSSAWSSAARPAR